MTFPAIRTLSFHGRDSHRTLTKKLAHNIHTTSSPQGEHKNKPRRRSMAHLISYIMRFFRASGTTEQEQNNNNMDKYLIVGLGNPGAEYHETRHNSGWMVADKLAADLGATFSDKRYGYIAEASLKGRKLFILKPTTFMNLSGNAVRYWLNKENIDTERLLVIVDELAFPVGKMKLKGSGSNGGHNGLGHIQQLIGQKYARLRIGIGNEFAQGRQVDYVLGKFTDEERTLLNPLMDKAVECIKSFVLAGIDRTMNQYNK